MPKRQTVAEILAEQEICRNTILEVEQAEDPTEADLQRSDEALTRFEDLEVARAEAVEREDRLEVVRNASFSATNACSSRPRLTFGSSICSALPLNRRSICSRRSSLSFQN